MKKWCGLAFSIFFSFFLRAQDLTFQEVFEVAACNDDVSLLNKMHKRTVRDNQFDEQLTDRVHLRYPASVYYPAHQGTYPLIMLSHGWNSTQDYQRALARFLAAQGFVTVVFTSRAQRRPPDFLSTFDSVYALMQRVNEQEGSPLYRKVDFTRVRVLGHSMGGTAALHYANRYPERIRTVVALHPFNGGADMVNMVGGKNEQLGTDLRSVRAAVLILTGTKDMLAYPERSYEFFQSLPQDVPACFLSLKGMGHGAGTDKYFEVWGFTYNKTLSVESFALYRRLISAWFRLFLREEEEYRALFNEHGRPFRNLKPHLSQETGRAHSYPFFCEQNISN